MISCLKTQTLWSSTSKTIKHLAKNIIKLGDQNINWLSNKIYWLVHFLDEETPDFIILTEHSLYQENLEKTLP